MESGFYGKSNNLLLGHPTYTFIRFQAHSTHPPKERSSEYSSQVNKSSHKEIAWSFKDANIICLEGESTQLWNDVWDGARTKNCGNQQMRKLVASKVWIYSKCSPLWSSLFLQAGSESCAVSVAGATWGRCWRRAGSSTPALPGKSSLRGLGASFLSVSLPFEK